MAINTYGLNIDLDSFAKASADSVDCIHPGHYNQLVYDRRTGNVWTRYICSDGHWVVDRDPDVITVCSFVQHRSEQWLVDQIRDAL